MYGDIIRVFFSAGDVGEERVNFFNILSTDDNSVISQWGQKDDNLLFYSYQ